MFVVRSSASAALCSLSLLLAQIAAAQPAATATPEIKAAPSSADVAALEKLEKLSPGDPYADEAARQINELLDSSSLVIRWRAARAAGMLGISNPRVVEKLQLGARHENWVVQLHSIAALAKTGDKSDKTIETLTQAALSQNTRVAAAAISGLRSLKVEPQKLAGTLNKVLASGDGAVAVYAVEAMVEAGAKAVPLLKALLKEPNTAYWACVAIADIGPAAAGTVPELAEFLQNNDQFESAPQALLALAAIGPAAEAAAPAVTETLQRFSDDQSVQLAGMYALGSIGATNAEQLLQNGAKSDDAFEAMVATWALAKTSPGDDQRMQAAIQHLVKGLESDNPQIGHAAAQGLLTLDIPPGMAVPYLIAAAKNPAAKDHVVNALASLGKKALPHASKGLANPATRELAIEVLGRMGPDAAGATQALVACLDDADPEFCEQANNVLAQIGPSAAAATAALVKELAAPQADVRQSAMYALREIGPAASLAKAALLRHMEQADVDTPAGSFERLATAWTLSRIDPHDQQLAKQLVPVILEGLESNSELERRESISAAVDLGKAAGPLKGKLEQLAESDPDSSVRGAASAAVAALK